MVVASSYLFLRVKTIGHAIKAAKGGKEDEKVGMPPATSSRDMIRRGSLTKYLDGRHPYALAAAGVAKCEGDHNRLR